MWKRKTQFSDGNWFTYTAWSDNMHTIECIIFVIVEIKLQPQQQNYGKMRVQHLSKLCG